MRGRRDHGGRRREARERQDQGGGRREEGRERAEGRAPPVAGTTATPLCHEERRRVRRACAAGSCRDDPGVGF
eukprot:2588874-Pyramimonas_sp.AAC.1